MKKIFFVILSLFCTVFATMAQQDAKAVQLLDNARAIFEKSSGMYADFSIAILNKGKIADASQGKIWMKGRKFRFSTDVAEVWYDGKNQWLLNRESDEVNLSAPTDAEMESVNPSVLFQIYKKGYKLKYKGVKTVSGKKCDCVEMISTQKSSDIARIVLLLDAANAVPFSIDVYNKNKSGQNIVIQNYRSNLSLADAFFVFNPKQFPKAEVIDLR